MALPTAPPAVAPATPPTTFAAVLEPIRLPATPPITAPAIVPTRVCPGLMSTGWIAVIVPNWTDITVFASPREKDVGEGVGVHPVTTRSVTSGTLKATALRRIIPPSGAKRRSLAHGKFSLIDSAV